MVLSYNQSNQIHKFACVSKNTELDGITVEPFVYIEDGVCIGKDSVIRKGATIHTGTTMGKNCNIGENSVLGGAPQDLSFDHNRLTGLQIGNDTTIREMVTVSRSTREEKETQIGSRCLLMALSHVGHDSTIEDNVVICNNTLIGGHVLAQEGCFISGNCSLHQFIRLGCLSMISGGSRLSQDVPPFTIAFDENIYSGVNSIGLRRGNISLSDRNLIKKAYQFFYKKGTGEQNKTKKINWLRENLLNENKDNQYIKKIIDFIESSKRGVII